MPSPDWTRCEHGVWHAFCGRCKRKGSEPDASFVRSADGQSAVFTLLGVSFWIDLAGNDGVSVKRMEPLDVEGREDLAGSDEREKEYERQCRIDGVEP